MTWHVVDSSVIASYGVNVAAGNIVGVTCIDKFGKNDAVGSSQETVWEGGGTYTYPSGDDISLSVSSDDDSDTHEITVVGLDAAFAEQTKTVTLAGQTETAVDGTWARVFRSYNSSATATQTSATVYIYDADETNVVLGVPQTSTNIHAQWMAENEQTLMALYTVPAGKTGYLMNLYGNSTVPAAAEFEVHLRVRETGGVFRTLHDAHITQVPQWAHTFPNPLVLPAQTDVEIVSSASTGSRVVTAGFAITLINN